MSYEITVSNKSKGDKKLTVHCDKVEALIIPGPVAISIGNKEKIYRDWLDKAMFGSHNKQKLLNFMVRLYDKALELGDMELVCNCKFNKFHTKVLREFILSNRDTFGSLISYLVPDSKNKSILEASKTNTDTPKEEGNSNPSNFSGRDLNRFRMSNKTLPAHEMDQINELIRQDIEKNRLDALNVDNSITIDQEPIEVTDECNQIVNP